MYGKLVIDAGDMVRFRYLPARSLGQRKYHSRRHLLGHHNSAVDLLAFLSYDSWKEELAVVVAR